MKYIYILFLACITLTSCSFGSQEQVEVSSNDDTVGPQIHSVNKEEGKSLNSF